MSTGINLRNRKPDTSPKETLSPELALLVFCACHGPEETRDEMVCKFISQISSWKKLLFLARLHRLIPRLNLLLSSIPANLVPQDIRESLRFSFQRQSQRNVVCAFELSRITAAFESTGIPLLSFKGPTLAQDVFGGLEQRQFDDLDVLIPCGALLDSARLLRDLGYRGLGVRVLDTSPGQIRRLTRWYKDITFYRVYGRSRVTLELHWRLAEDPEFFNIEPDRLWDSGSYSTIAGRKIRTLHPDALVPYLAYHAVSHRFRRLSWVSDFSHALRSGGSCEMGSLCESASKLGVERYFSLGRIALDILRQAVGLRAAGPGLAPLHTNLERAALNMCSKIPTVIPEQRNGFASTIDEASWRLKLSGNFSPMLKMLAGWIFPTKGDLLHYGPAGSFFGRWRHLTWKYSRNTTYLGNE